MPCSSWCCSTTAAIVRAGTDPVAAHDQRLLRAVLVEEASPRAARCSRVPSLKMWPTSIAVWKPQRAAAVRARVALAHLADVREARPRSLARPRRRAGGARSRFAPATNWPSRSASSATTSTDDPDRADRAGIGAERFADLLLGRRPKCLAERLEHLALVEPVVAADEAEHDLAVSDDGHRLRRRRRVDAEELRDVLDRRHAGRLDLLRRVERAPGTRPAAGSRARSRGRPRSRPART